MAQKTGSPVAAAIAGASGARPGPELIQLRELIYQTTGIFQPNLKLHLLADACSSRMQALDLPTLGRYYEFLTAPTSGHAELSALLNRITVGETCFFRNQPQLDALCNVVLPRIVRARQPMPKRHLRIWSAGCSTGVEPYTLSLLLLEELTGRLQGWTFEKASGFLLRGQQRANFLFERFVAGARLPQECFALLERMLEHRLQELVDLFPPFAIHRWSRARARGRARLWRCSSPASR